jgi:hypothetical protein
MGAEREGLPDDDLEPSRDRERRMVVGGSLWRMVKRGSPWVASPRLLHFLAAAGHFAILGVTDFFHIVLRR